MCAVDDDSSARFIGLGVAFSIVVAISMSPPLPPRPVFVHADDGNMVATRFIRWAVEKDRCWYVCTKDNGCTQEPSDMFDDKFKLCGTAEYHTLSALFSGES